MSRQRTFVEDLIRHGGSLDNDKDREAYYKAEMTQKVIPLPAAGPWSAEIRFQRQLVSDYYAALHRRDRPETSQTPVMRPLPPSGSVRTRSECTGQPRTRIDLMNEYALFLAICRDRLGDNDQL